MDINANSVDLSNIFAQTTLDDDDDDVAKKQQLYKGAHSKSSTFSSVLDVTFEEGKGRKVVVRERVPTGALLIRERAYSSSTPAAAARLLCAGCCRPLGCLTAPLQCPQCCRDTVNYCSQPCRDDAWKSFHSTECDGGPNADKRSTESLPGKIHHAVRTILVTSVSDLIKYDPSKSTRSALIGKYGLKENEPIECDYRQVMSLYAHKFRENDKIWTQSCALVDAYLMQRGYYARADWPTDYPVPDRRALVKRVAQDLLFTLVCNAHAISPFYDMHGSLTQRIRSKDESAIVSWRKRRLRLKQLAAAVHASGLYPVYSLVNHSCLQNVMQYNDGNIVELRALRDLAAGEELYTNYSSMFGIHTRAQRQAHLLRQYHFTCACRACTGSKEAEVEQRKTAYRCTECARACARLCTDTNDEAEGRIACTECCAQQPYTLNTVRQLQTRVVKMTRQDVSSDTTNSIEDHLVRLEGLCDPLNECLTRARLECTAYFAKCNRDRCEALHNDVLHAYREYFTPTSLGYQQLLARVVMTNYTNGIAGQSSSKGWCRELYHLMADMTGVQGARNWLCMDYGDRGLSLFTVLHREFGGERVVR